MKSFDEKYREMFFQGSLRVGVDQFFQLHGFALPKRFFRMGSDTVFLKRSTSEVELECLELFKELGINKINAGEYQIEISWFGEVLKVYEYKEIWCKKENEEE
jgi:hypothetical protein